MVYSCGAINCSERWRKGVNLKFHRIPPKDCDLRKAWIIAMKRANYNPKYGFVCGKHFLESDYVINVHGNKILKKGAIPSVFDFPSHLKKVVRERRLLKRKETVLCQPNNDNVQAVVPMEIDVEEREEPIAEPMEEVSLVDENVSKPSTSTTGHRDFGSRQRRDAIYFGDFKESDMESEEKRKRFWKMAHETVFKYRKVNKYYQCKVRRQKAQIKNLNALLEELKNSKKYLLPSN